MIDTTVMGQTPDRVALLTESLANPTTGEPGIIGHPGHNRRGHPTESTLKTHVERTMVMIVTPELDTEEGTVLDVLGAVTPGVTPLEVVMTQGVTPMEEVTHDGTPMGGEVTLAATEGMEVLGMVVDLQEGPLVGDHHTRTAVGAWTTMQVACAPRLVTIIWPMRSHGLCWQLRVNEHYS